MTTTIRCSALPHLMAAPCSVLGDGTRIDPQNPAAADGSAAHELLSHLVATGERAFDRVPEVCARWPGADEKNVRILLAQGAKLWAAREGDYPAPMTEVPMRETYGDLTLTGTADVVSVREDRTAHVADHKTARMDRDYYWQIAGYAALVMAEWPDVDTVHGEVWWVRDGETERYTFRRADMPALIARIADRVRRWTPGSFEPGETCRHCSLARSCPGARQLAERDAAVLAVPDGDLDLMTADPERVHELFDAAKRASDAVDRVVDAVRRRAEVAPIVHDGHALALREVAGNRKIDVVKAWPVLTARFGADDLASVLDLRVGAAGDLVRERTEKGKGAAVKVFNEELEAAGAVTRTPTMRLEKKRI